MFLYKISQLCLELLDRSQVSDAVVVGGCTDCDSAVSLCSLDIRKPQFGTMQTPSDCALQTQTSATLSIESAPWKIF